MLAEAEYSSKTCKIVNMSLNLNKHGSVLREVWKELQNDQAGINWALFGYEGNTFDLKLISKGELILNQIIYVYEKIHDK